MKISAAERIQIGATLDAVLVTLNELKHPAITEPYGDQNAVEPRDAIAWINGQIDELYAMASCELNVSRETVENLVRDFRDKMRNWPGV